jgi:mannose-6-phosphate isomerase-like protein (cupin superfamily)
LGSTPVTGIEGVIFSTMTDKIILSEKFAKLPQGDYAAGIVAKMNNYDVKIVKFKGEFVWHSHPDTDETFIVLEGVLTMNFRDRAVDVRPGELIVISKGVEHKPSSVDGYRALLIEPENVPNTGGVESDMAIDRIGWV